MKRIVQLIVAISALGCCPDLEPPAQYVQSLPGGAQFVIDVEMWDACERNYSTTVSYVSESGSIQEGIATTNEELSEIEFVDARLPAIWEVTREAAALAFKTEHLLILRLRGGKYGAETLVVRNQTGQWSEHLFREESYANEALWLNDLRPFDEGTSGFSELVRFESGKRSLIVRHHSGWVIRELTFSLSEDGSKVELEHVGRAHSDLSRTDVPEGFRHGEFLARAGEIFAASRVDRLDDVRILELRDCPDGEAQDVARVLFGFHTQSGYSHELWRLYRKDDEWHLDQVELVEPLGIDVLDQLRATYPRGTRCVNYL